LHHGLSQEQCVKVTCWNKNEAIGSTSRKTQQDRAPY